jgi:NUMOD4 motif
MKERWKTVEGFIAYEISDLGRVRRCLPGKSTVQGRILKPTPDKNGYLTVRVCVLKGTKKHTLKIHRLVARAFIPNPEKLPEVNHLGNNKDNRAIKLEWISRPDHCADIAKRHQIGSGVSFCKDRNKWRARRTVLGKRITLGHFSSKKAALSAVATIPI